MTLARMASRSSSSTALLIFWTPWHGGMISTVTTVYTEECADIDKDSDTPYKQSVRLATKVNNRVHALGHPAATASDQHPSIISRILQECCCYTTSTAYQVDPVLCRIVSANLMGIVPSVFCARDVNQESVVAM